MKMFRTAKWVFICVFLFASCKAKKGEVLNAEAEDGSLFGGGSSLADAVMGALTARLKAQAQLSDAQAAHVTKGSISKMKEEAAKLGLTEATPGYLNSYTDFANEMVSGALQSLSKKGLGVKSRKKVNDILKTVVNHTFQEMRGRIENIEDNSFYLFLEQLMRDTVGNLKNAGYKPFEMDNAAGTIMETAFANLNTAHLLSENNAKKVASAILKGTILAFKDIGLNYSGHTSLRLEDSDGDGDFFDDDQDTAETEEASGESTDDNADHSEFEQDFGGADYVYESPLYDDNTDFNKVDVLEDLASFDASKPPQVSGENPDPRAVIAAMLFFIMKDSVLSLKHLGLSNDQVVNVTGAMMHTMIGAMDEAGFTKPLIISVLDEAVYGPINAIEGLGLDVDRIISMVGIIGKGTVSALDEIQDKLDTTSRRVFIEVMLYTMGSRIAHIKTLKGVLLKLALESLALGSMSGLSNAKVKSTELADLAAEMVEILVRAGQESQNQGGSHTFKPAKLIEDLVAIGLAVAASKKTFPKDFKTKFQESLNEIESISEFLGDKTLDTVFTNAAEDAEDYAVVEDEEEEWGDEETEESENSEDSDSEDSEDSSDESSDDSSDDSSDSSDSDDSSDSSNSDDSSESSDSEDSSEEGES